MFLNYYRLREQPFGATPDPRFLYLGRTHREALASLFYGVLAHRGFMALVAPPGMGKTTLLFQLLERLRGRARTAFLFQTQCDSRELLRYLLHDLGITPGEDLVAMHQQLNEVLLQEAAEGRTLVVVIDEAQDLAEQTLETVRLLSDFETSQRKLLQIILAGQPQLARTLAAPGMAQFRQRIAILGRIEPLDRREVERYILHRMEAAGYQGGALFTADALKLIAEASEGIPRNINNLCFNALSLGCALQQKRIGGAIVAEVLADRDLESLLPEKNKPNREAMSARFPPKPVAAPAARWRFSQALALRAAALIMAVGLLWFSALKAGNSAWTQPAPPVAAASPTEARTAAVQPSPATLPKSVEPKTDPVRATTHPDRTIVVEPAQTLAQISRRYVGRYDSRLIAEIQALNPEMTDPNHLEVGQRIRLPQMPGPARKNHASELPWRKQP